MNEILEFLVHHGAAVLFAAVFVEQMGVPLPATPWLLASGALVGAGKMNWIVTLGVAAFGSVLADLIWFYLGRNYGNQVLNLLCRISLEPDSCARRTQNLFTRHGMRGIVAAKFIPGLSTLAPPLAGSSGVSAPRFLLFDGLGSLLYAGCFILVGVLFSPQLGQVIDAFAGLGSSALGLVAGLVVLYIGYKYFQRHRLLRELPVIEGAADALWRLSDSGVWIRIITHRLYVNWGHAIAVSDTVAWLDEARIPYRDICFLGRKPEVEADCYVDDSPDVIDALREAGNTAIVFDAPYNRHLDGPRAETWNDVENEVARQIAERGIPLQAALPGLDEGPHRLQGRLDR